MWSQCGASAEFGMINVLILHDLPASSLLGLIQPLEKKYLLKATRNIPGQSQ